MALQLDVCVGPLDPLCQAANGVAGSVGGAASDAILGGLGASFVTAAQQVTTTALSVLDAGSGIDLNAAWFRQNLSVIAAVTLPAVVALFVLQVVGAVLRREPGGLGRAVVGVAKALLGAGLAISVTQLALVASDQICSTIAAAAGTSVAGAAAQFLEFSWLQGPQAGPVLQMMLGVGLIVGMLLLWGVLLFRKAALILVAVFAPVAFAGLAWDQTRVWARRWIEIVAALVFSKVVVVVVFVVGSSAFAGVGPATGPATGTGPSPSGSLSDLLAGLLLLTIAVFAPWLTWRFVHWTGMEAAAVMHSAVAAGPIPAAGREAAAQARFTTQSAVTGLVLGPGGAATAAAGASSAAAAARGSAPPGAASRVAVTPSHQGSGSA